jgi:hypothetical protein
LSSHQRVFSRRRYLAGLRNLVNLYLPLFDTVLAPDNSNVSIGDEGQIIAEKDEGGELQIADPVIWQQILDTTKG